jgi:Chaperone of endosialidase
MPYMLAEEHMGYVVIDPGLPRTDVTLAAAVSSIGSSRKTLVLTFSGDGVWSINANLTIPANVTLMIPAGITVNRASGVTLVVLGTILSFSDNWETGPGLTNRGIGNPVELSSIETLMVSVARAGEGLRVTNPTTNAYISVTTFQGTSVPAVQFIRVPGTDASNWEVANSLSNFEWIVARPNGLPHLSMNNTGLWVSNGSSYTTPAHLLHLQLDDAFKPGDGTWDFPSDGRLKTVERPYTDGLAMLQALPNPVVYTYNGKAETPMDGKEYVGMIGQDVEPVAPYMISTYQGKLEPTDPDPTTILSMNNSSMVYALINAVKELADRVAALEGVPVRSVAAEGAPPEARSTRPRRGA